MAVEKKKEQIKLLREVIENAKYEGISIEHLCKETKICYSQVNFITGEMTDIFETDDGRIKSIKFYSRD